MPIPIIPMNEKAAFTEYEVSTPTSDFAIGFDYAEGVHNIIVRIDDIPIEATTYAATLINPLTVQIVPAVPSGTVRISRETDIDENLYKFSGGALFTATTMDANFEQIRNSQQELRDETIHIARAEELSNRIDAEEAARIDFDNRALRFPVGGIDANPFPDAATRANKFPVFDAAGQVSLSSGTGADAGLRGDLAAASGAALMGDASGNTQAVLNGLLDTTVENIADLPTTLLRSCYVRSHHSGSRLGGGRFNWDANKDKALHDGGTVIDPLMLSVLPSDWTNSGQVATWLTNGNVGSGCWVRDTSVIPTIFDYGFTPNVLANNATNTLMFQKLVDVNRVSRVPYYDAPLYVTKGINVKNGRSIVGDNEYMGEPLLADPDRGIIGDGSGAVFTTGTYPATANTNRQLHFKSLRVRNTTYPCFDLLHSDDAVMDDCIAYTTGGTAVRQFYSARVRYLGGHYASSFTTYSDDNFCMRIYDNCNGTWISPTTVIAGGANGGGVDVTKSQKVVLDGIIETNGGYGVRVAGYNGGDLPLWQPTTAYSRGDRVKNTTNAWVCMTSHTSGGTFSATNWEVTNGNCNAATVNGYFEATNKPVSLGANNLVLGAKLGTSSLYVGGTNSPDPKFSIELGAVSGLNLSGGVSLHKKGTEPTFKFVQPSSGSSITDYLTNSTIKNFHVQGGGSDFENGLTTADQIGFVFGRNEIKLNRTAITSGQVREFVSPVITANVGLAVNAFIIDTGNGGEINAIEIINATGTLGCTIRVGHPAADGENLVVDPSTLTLSNGAATTTLASTLIRPAKQQTIRVVAGAGTGTFRLRIQYRM